MSLQLWIPFTNKVENLGLKNCELTTNNITSVDGKINQYAAHFNGNNSWISIKNPPDLNITDFSFAFWLKTYTDTTNNMCIYNGRFYIGDAIAIFISNGSIRFDDGGQHDNLLTIEKNKWYHIVIARNSTNIKIYSNGNLYKTTSSTSFTLNKITYASIGCSSYVGSITPKYNPLDGDLNDFRIYDHCLSDKEVKELSKGLILHYKLSKSLNSNLITTDFVATATKSSYYRSHTIINNLLTPEIIMANQGRTLWFSYDIYTPGTRKDGNGTNTTINRFGIHGVIVYNNGTEDKTLYPFNESLNYSGDLIRLEKSYVIPSDIVSISAFYFAIHCGVSNFSSPADDNDETWYIKNLKLEWDTPTPYSPHTKYDNDDIEYDYSGYGNHGEKHDIIQDNTDIIKYNSNYIFNGNSSYIKNISDIYRIKDEITINLWAYMDNWNNFNSRLISCAESAGYNFEAKTINNILYIQFTIYNNQQYIYALINATELLSGWHMFTATYDGYKALVYVDGNFINTSDISENKLLIEYSSTANLIIGAESSANSVIGPFFNGKMSDLRIYGTALSEDDIKELYNVPTSLDNNGNIFTGELIEED